MWFKGLLDKSGLVGYRRNLCLLDRFFGDFVWRRNKVVVEIDGSSHKGKECYDHWRDSKLREKGFVVFRVPHNDNEKALKCIEEVKTLLRIKIKKKNKKFKLFKKPNKRAKFFSSNTEARFFFKKAQEERISALWLKRNKPLKLDENENTRQTR